uniref:Butyrophilin subfamily 1 member A1 n=1 Tax=Chelonoidis abingdonii TaxID=106734 RepID=A0A8C0GQP4_CHEAB
HDIFKQKFLLEFNCFCVLFHLTAHFSVIGPNHPITASVGDEVTLACHLSPRMSAENMEVRWFRGQLSSVVHLYREGKDQYAEQMSEYRQRTEFLKEDLADGRVALRIGNIRLSDSGLYKCFFRSEFSYQEAALELQVSVSGTNPLISVEGYQDGGIRMVCQSGGWYPEPQSLWKDLKGQPLPSLPAKCFRDENGLLVRYAVCPTSGVFNLLSMDLQGSKKVIHEIKGTGETENSFLLPVNVTLDRETAHPELLVSKDLKSVKCADITGDQPKDLDIVDSYRCVLGSERFNSGRHYWEVELKNKTMWHLGVCADSENRESYKNINGEYKALSTPRTTITLEMKPTKVGIFLDYEAAELSFYNLCDDSHIYTFKLIFSGTLRPFFSPGIHGSKEDAPLTICPSNIPIPGTADLQPLPGLISEGSCDLGTSCVLLADSDWG